jgi:aldehyde:ferredoxin oxidoreductase
LYIVTEGSEAGNFGEDLGAPAAHYGGTLGVTDPDFIFWGASFSDEYGVDVADMTGAIAYVMECFEKGILSEEDLNGLRPDWGNTAAIKQLMRMTVYREGIGDLLAEGALRASRVIGKDSEKYYMHVKGLYLDACDPRGSKAWALGYAVGSRGADHCRHIHMHMGTPLVEEIMKQQVDGFQGFDLLSEEGKGRPHAWFEDVRAFEAGVEICLFAAMRYPFWLNMLSEVFRGLTGLDLDPAEIRKIGERINNLERAFNIREGLTRADDTLPERFLRERFPEGESRDTVVDIDRMVDDYYEARNWDKATGFPARNKLEELGLAHVADELASLGKSIH